MIWKLVSGAVVLVAGYFGYQYYVRHRHTASCPTAEQVRAVVMDVESNKISITAAQLRADSWEHDGCQIAADAVRSMIRVRAAREKIAEVVDAATPIETKATEATFSTTGGRTARGRVLARR